MLNPLLLHLIRVVPHAAQNHCIMLGLGGDEMDRCSRHRITMIIVDVVLSMAEAGWDYLAVLAVLGVVRLEGALRCRIAAQGCAEVSFCWVISWVGEKL